MSLCPGVFVVKGPLKSEYPVDKFAKAEEISVCSYELLLGMENLLMSSKSLLIPIMLGLAALVLIGCNANDSGKAASKPLSVQSGTATTYADGARRITIAEFDELLKQGQAFVVDVRNQQAYDDGHLPGAVLIPAGEILNHLSDLPRDKMIVTYCS